MTDDYETEKKDQIKDFPTFLLKYFLSSTHSRDVDLRIRTDFGSRRRVEESDIY